MLVILLATLGFSCIQTKNGNTVTSSKSVKPNIIYILADDLGTGDISSLNAESKILTPNIDQLVNSGIYFTDAHSNSAVCTPTRYGILTGQYAFRTRLKDGVLWGYSPSLIARERKTVGNVLQENGYTTACIGKWHLGLDWQKMDESQEIPDFKWDDVVLPETTDNVDFSKYVKGGPSDHGFDYSFIIPASLDMSPYCFVRNGWVVTEPTDYTPGKSETNDGRGMVWRAGKMSPGFDFYNVLPAFIDSSCQYISKHSESVDPFFLYLALPSPHTPWVPTDQYKKSSGAGLYGDYVTMVDDVIGKILEQVKTSGLDENTLVILTSDNGADWRPGDIEEYTHTSNSIYKGRKADIFEAGHRVPFIARWEGVIKAGTSSSQLMCTTDLMATVAGVLGVTLPDDTGEDSENMWPAFLGEAISGQMRHPVVHHSLDGFFSIRSGKWKFTPHLGSGGFTVPKLIEAQDGEAPGTLYDMENDPEEKVNLYHKYPDVVAELGKLLEDEKNRRTRASN